MTNKFSSHKKEGNGMVGKLLLRVLFFEHQNVIRGICLETNIAVQAETFEGATQKMQDATILYMTSFSPEELIKQEYLRPAPVKYSVMCSLFLSKIYSWIKKRRNRL